MSAPPIDLTALLGERTLAGLFARANAARWGLERRTFEKALGRSAAGRFGPAGVGAADLERFLDSLHLEDLALASACAEGRPAAWTHFVESYRPALRAAARAIGGDSEGADLADDLYSELYGIEERDGQRRSLFDYFHGRSRLATWLRAVMSQRHVDRIRQNRRNEPLDEASCSAPAFSSDSSGDPDRRRYAKLAQAVLAVCISRLEPRDRLRLSCYYLQHLTLARIGRMFGEHEATASRKLDRLRSELRNGVERVLRREHGLSEAQVRACFEYALEDTTVNLERALGGASAGQESGG